MGQNMQCKQGRNIVLLDPIKFKKDLNLGLFGMFSLDLKLLTIKMIEDPSIELNFFFIRMYQLLFQRKDQ